MFLEAQNTNGMTALLIASDGGNYELMDLLIKAGADLTARGGEYKSVKDIALGRFPLPPRDLCPAVYQVQRLFLNVYLIKVI